MCISHICIYDSHLWMKKRKGRAIKQLFKKDDKVLTTRYLSPTFNTLNPH